MLVRTRAMARKSPPLPLPRLDTWQDLELPLCFNTVSACEFGDEPGELRTAQGEFFAASDVPSGHRAYTLTRWDLDARRRTLEVNLPVSAFTEKDYPTFPLAFDRAMKHFVARTGRHHLGLFDVVQGDILARWPIPGGGALVAVLGEACLGVFATSSPARVFALDVRTGRTRWTLTNVRWLGALADELLGVVERVDGIAVVKLFTGDTFTRASHPPSPCTVANTSADGRTLVGFDASGAMFVARKGVWTPLDAREDGAPDAVVVSPGGRYAVTLRPLDKSLHAPQRMVLYDLTKGAELTTSDGVTSRPAFSRDERSMVFGQGLGLARVTLATGVMDDLHAYHRAPVRCVAVARSGRVASGSSDHTVRVWVAGEPSADTVFEGHGAEVTALAFSPAEPLLVSGDRGGSVRCWDLDARIERGAFDSPIARLRPTESAAWRWNVEALTFSEDGRLCVAMGRIWGGTPAVHHSVIVAWEVARGAVVASFSLPNRPYVARLLAVRERGVAVAWANGQLGWYSLADGAETLQQIGSSEDWRWVFVRLLEGHRALAIATKGVYTWDLTSGAIEPHGPRPDGFYSEHVAVALDGSVIASTNDTYNTNLRRVLTFDGHTSELLGVGDLPQENDLVQCLALSPDAAFVVVGTRRGGVIRFGTRPTER
jgi:WD40 repeat protein